MCVEKQVEFCHGHRSVRPVTAPERSKACTVFARSEAGVVGLNPTQGMDVWCLCVCARARFSVFVYR
jgi:hypothetical protein